MKQELEAIRAKALEAIGGAEKAEDLEALRVQYLGKRGELTAVLNGGINLIISCFGHIGSGTMQLLPKPG